eukprot:Rmarinus@m.25398
MDSGFRKIWDLREICVSRWSPVPSDRSPASNQMLLDSGFIIVANRQPCKPVLTLETLISTPKIGEGTMDMESRANVELFLRNRWNLWMQILKCSSPHFVLQNGKEAAFSISTHPLTNTKRSKVDIMFTLNKDGLNYPALLIEIMSEGDNSLVVKKAIALLALCAELAWDENFNPYDPEDDQPPIPTSLCALSLPGYGANGPLLKISVSWDHSRLRYVVSYEALPVSNDDEFEGAVCQCLVLNRPVYQYLHKRVVVDNIRPCRNLFRTVYRLSGAQLLDINESLGSSTNSFLRQMSSNTAFVFVRLSKNHCPSLFF